MTSEQGPSQVTTAGELDRRRVLRVLRERVRYRYVRPVLQAAEGGWRISSPCCSRNVDSAGGMIDIAWLKPVADGWRIYYKDHAAKRWTAYRDGRLSDLLETLRLDPERRFWP
ncbi:MAG: hypothetical protein JNK68_08440 [Betaproteobacteria bacterium]|nr:hypothetical protein [Betaproteobacteria bacterium]